MVDVVFALAVSSPFLFPPTPSTVKVDVKQCQTIVTSAKQTYAEQLAATLCKAALSSMPSECESNLLVGLAEADHSITQKDRDHIRQVCKGQP